MLQVTTPPTATNLTTLDVAAAEVGSELDPVRLAALVAQASAACEGFCGRSLAQVSVTETFFGAAYPLVLSLTPISVVGSVSEGSEALTADAYMLDMQSGVLYRHYWAGCSLGCVAVAYTAGYVLPGQDGRNLPADIERACLEVVKALWFAGGSSGARDPAIRSESVEGIGSTSYLDPRAENGGLPEMAAALLRPYQRLGL